MKTTYILLAAATLFTASCEQNREPETVLADNNFWKSETDLRGACNRMYIDLDGFSHDLRSDELVATSPNGISSGNRTVPATSGDWNDPYNAIGVCNNIIVKGAQAPLTDAQKNRWLAEAYFFRAWNYFDLVKKYGDVPLVLKTFTSTDDPEIKKPRTPREEVIKQCYEDLKFAETWLPDIDKVASATDWGRVSKSAAQGLLCRIGLYEGTYEKYHKFTDNWREDLTIAVEAAQRLIKSGKHSLYPDFYKLFRFDGEGRQNRENVFVKIYGPNEAGTLTHNNSRTMENQASVTRQTIDQFLYTDGLSREKSPLAKAVDTSYNDVFQNRDPRLALTIFQLGEDAYKGAYIPFNNQHGNGYPLKKGFMIEQWQLNSKETVDKMIIRYAEVLLSYAEALYELNGSITDEQLNLTVNAIRARVGFNVKLTNAFVQTNGLNMLNEIRRERLVEFIDENLHYDDIIRWKTAENVLPKPIIGLKYVESEVTAKRVDIQPRLTTDNGMFNGTQVYNQADMFVIETADTRKFDPEKDYLYPIPTYEIGTSGGNIKQNPKW